MELPCFSPATNSSRLALANRPFRVGGPGGTRTGEEAVGVGEQLGGGPELGRAALVHDQDHVAVDDGVQAVRDRHHRLLAKLLPHLAGPWRKGLEGGTPSGRPSARLEQMGSARARSAVRAWLSSRRQHGQGWGGACSCGQPAPLNAQGACHRHSRCLSEAWAPDAGPRLVCQRSDCTGPDGLHCMLVAACPLTVFCSSASVSTSTLAVASSSTRICTRAEQRSVTGSREARRALRTGGLQTGPLHNAEPR